MNTSIHEPDHYIFVVTGVHDAYFGEKRNARDVLYSRLSTLSWPLNSRTRYQARLRAGDKVLFYVAGVQDPDRYSILAKAKLAGPRMQVSRRIDATQEWLGPLGPVSMVVPLEKPEWLTSPVEVKPLIERLRFISNKVNWGNHFRGGIVAVTAEDFDLLSAG
jgi:hypothetical protein